MAGIGLGAVGALRGRILALLVVAIAAGLAACGGDDDSGDSDDATAQPLGGACQDVEYGGEGEPEALIASDLPMQGDSRERSEQMVEAILLALEESDWSAGDVTVGFQACDDSIAATGLWDPKQCRENAEAYAGNATVLGVVGTYNSGCAAEIIPILNEAPDGPVAMVSPGNTFVCLTESSKTCDADEPDSYYPSGERNYARVVPNDAFQGAALAELAEMQGGDSAYVLYAADDDTSLGQATNFRNAAEDLGIEIAGYESWDPKASDYRDLMEDVERSGAGVVVLAGLTEQNAGKVIQDKVEVLGPNDGDVALIGFDGLTQQDTIDEAKGAAEGMLASIPGRAPPNLTGAGAEFAEALSTRVDDDPIEQFAPFAGEATEVLLQAIESGGDDRAAVAADVFGIEREDGIVGSYEVTDTGDPSVGPVTVFRAAESFEPEDEIAPSSELVDAARGG
jgi:branched-chain amino acid transport system substrate-binding protein